MRRARSIYNRPEGITDRQWTLILRGRRAVRWTARIHYGDMIHARINAIAHLDYLKAQWAEADRARGIA